MANSAKAEPEPKKGSRWGDAAALFRLFIENARDYGAFTADRRGRISDWNLSAQRIFGYKTHEILGRPITRLFPRSAVNTDRFRRCIEGKAEDDQCEGWWTRKNQELFWGHCICRALPDQEGQVHGFGLIIRDLTTLMQAEGDRRILASIIDNSDDAIIGKDLKGTVLKWNKAAEHLFGYQENEIVGKSIMLLVPPERLAEERLILSRLGRGERMDHFETVRLRRDGRPIDVSISVSPIRSTDGQLTGASTILRDITERKRASLALQEHMQLLQGILDTAADAIITINEGGAIQSTNAATEKLFGYAPSELIGLNVNRLMPEPFHGEHDGYLRNYCRTGIAKIIGLGREVTGLCKDGRTFPMHLAVSEIKLKDQRLFTGIVHDLTERRRLERQIMETAANEQRRIGQDLHDGLCQDLVGIAFTIDTLSRNLPANIDKEPIAGIAAAVRDAASQARRLAHGLNPVDLKAGGLATALENLTAKVSSSFGVRCAFHWDRLAQVREDATATHLYRIAQEAAGNAIRHGKAKVIDIRLEERGSSLVLSIADNGKGMPPPIMEATKKGLVLDAAAKVHSGIGLQTMHYRARVMGGSFRVVPGKRGGTNVMCTISREQSLHPSKMSESKSGNNRRSKRRLSP